MARNDYQITTKLNFTVFIAAVMVALTCLTLASSSTSIWMVVFNAFIFSFVANTLFSLMHEAVHGYLFTNRKMNERVGQILAGFFPTSFTFQRFMHLGHHRRNRTDAEMFDLYYKEDNKLLKWAQLYGIFTGPYWLLVPLSATLVAVFPWLKNPDVQVRLHWRWLERTGVFAMTSGLSRVNVRRIQLEVLFGFLLHASMFYFLDLTLIGWAICYFMFAVNWGALQYADHAFSVRDIKDGAWNLRVSTPVRWVFLNYHCHLAHHQNPQVPWYHLPLLVSAQDYQPTFWQIFFAMLKGPRLVDEHTQPELDHALESELQQQGNLSLT